MPSRRVFKERILREVAALNTGASSSVLSAVVAAPVLTPLTSDDQVPVVDAPGTAPTLRKATMATVLAFIEANATAFQPVDADLTAIAALGYTANSILRKTAANTWDLVTTDRVPLFASAITGTPSGTTYLRGDGAWATVTGGSGDVVGPASSTDNAVARFDLATGKLLQNSAVTIADSGAVDIPAGSTTNALVVTTTGSIQQSLRYDAGTRWDVRVSSTGVVSFDAVGSDARYNFEDRISATTIDNSNPTLTFSAVNTVSGNTPLGIQGTASASHTSGTLATAIAGQFGVNIQGNGGTTTDAYATRSSISASSSSVLTNGYGVEVTLTTASGGVITNAYGIRVNNISVGATLNYAIYTGTGLVYFGDKVNIQSASGLEVNGTKVVGAQGAAVTDPTGGTVQDSEARTAIIAIIDRLQAHGLIA